jgi:methionine-rich copper-binding protein CopC
MVVLLATSPGMAWADDSLISADPPAGAVLQALPERVSLWFAGKVSGIDSHVAVSGAGDTDVTAGEVEQPGPQQLRIRLRSTAPGDLTVAYHVIFLDGGSATGMYRFSAGTGATPKPRSAAAQQAVTAAVSHHVHHVDGASALLLVVDGVVLVGVLFLLWARPRNGRPGAASRWRYRGEDGP